MFINIFLLVILFVFLALAADLVVKNVSYLAKVLQIRLFALGIILAIITTLPELSVGINASREGIAGLSVGNILGGVVVIFGLVLGLSLLFNRQVETDGELKSIVPQIAIIFLPLILGSDGVFSLFDGLILILAYLALVYYLYRTSRHFLNFGEGIAILEKKKILRAAFFSLVGIILVLLVSGQIVEVTTKILERWQVSRLVVGLLIFSVGTNLPEISIALTSWRKKASELSLSYLLSSAVANVLVLGVLSIINPLVFKINYSYYSLVLFLAVILSLLVIFYRSHKRLDRAEGAVLFLFYLLFLAVNFYLIK